MIRLEHFYILLGLMMVVASIMSLRDSHNPKRYSTSLFWALYALVYLAGDMLAPAVAGLVMVSMALIAGFGGVALGSYGTLSKQDRASSAQRLGNRLFIPALVIPAVTMIGATLLADVSFGGVPLLETKHITIVSLGCASILAVAAACWLTRSTPVQGMREWRRLADSMGWTIVLPHMLAVLGLLFAEAGVGKAVAHVATTYIPMDSRFVAVAVFCIGMALFTIIMGNGFAAFPVMAGGVGIPVLIGVYDANAAVMAAIGMFSAYCGTLMTPMAANFNIVPVALLELPDKNAVIKAQIPTAVPLLVANIFLLYFLMDQKP